MEAKLFGMNFGREFDEFLVFRRLIGSDKEILCYASATTPLVFW